jgi:hypothetical protein
MPAARYDGNVNEELISDDELTALALAADPDQGVDPSAVPLDEYFASASDAPSDVRVGLLPSWYMAPVAARRIGRLPQLICLVVIGTFILIEAVGLCSTYGQPFFH